MTVFESMSRRPVSNQVHIKYQRRCGQVKSRPWAVQVRGSGRIVASITGWRGRGKEYNDELQCGWE
jgi:hypothetical protein